MSRKDQVFEPCFEGCNHERADGLPEQVTWSGSTPRPATDGGELIEQTSGPTKMVGVERPASTLNVGQSLIATSIFLARTERVVRFVFIDQPCA